MTGTGNDASIRTPPRGTSRGAGRWRTFLIPIAGVLAVLAWLRHSQSRQPWMPIVTLIDRTVRWHRLPWPLGLPVLFALMGQLRRGNLFDPSTITPSLPPPRPNRPEDYLTVRTADGTFNDLAHPDMGSAGTRFGRNVPLERTGTEPDSALLTPNPRTVSRELMTRDVFQPATTLNVLTAAWIQFMLRDWLSHGNGPWANSWRLPLVADDPWPTHPMAIPRTLPDTTRPAEHDRTPRTFLNLETHWWDASQIYGSSETYQRVTRSGRDGKLRVDEYGLPAIEADAILPLHPADVPGFWLGLAMLGTLFTLEHNAICDRLRSAYPAWTDEDLFQHARLINAALMAKIHTVEWTTALLDHPPPFARCALTGGGSLASD